MGDITQVRNDALVCPANSTFEFFPGPLSEAFASAASMEVFKDAEQQAVDFIKTRGVRYRDSDTMCTPSGHAIVTRSGNIRHALSIIHVNNNDGTRRENDPENLYRSTEDIVRLCTRNALTAAEQDVRIRSVAFPALGAGFIMGLTLEQSLTATMRGIRDYLTIYSPNLGKLNYRL